jgi:hypothetical protein
MRVNAAVGVGSQCGFRHRQLRGWERSSTSERNKRRARPPPRENWDVGPTDRISLSTEMGLFFLLNKSTGLLRFVDFKGCLAELLFMSEKTVLALIVYENNLFDLFVWYKKSIKTAYTNISFRFKLLSQLTF